MRLSTDLEVTTLQKFAKEAKRGIVEIGVFDGETTKKLVEVAQVPVYGIDPIIPDSMNPGLVGNLEKIRQNTATYRHFTFIRDYSYNVAKNWNKTVDFIFLDGDHTFSAVSKDFEDWWSILSPGGVLFLHDTAPVLSEPNLPPFNGHPGPTELANKLKKENYECIGVFDTLTGFRKPINQSNQNNDTFSFIFQIHNREQTVQELLMPFIQAQQNGMQSQLIVCNDGSTDNTYQKIMEIMPRNNQNSVLTLFDAFEIELTWRAMQIAEGNVVAWIQDDDYYASMDFAKKASELFANTPLLAALSPKHGYMFGKQMQIIEHYGEYNSTDLSFNKHPTYRNGIMEVDAIDRAPFIFLRKYYNEVGGIDRGLIQDTYSENDLCLSWKERGYKIGIYHTDSYFFRRWKAGSSLPGSKVAVPKNIAANRARCYGKHKRYLESR